MGYFKTVCADPPWNEAGGGKIKRGADRHYPLIKKKEDILRVMLQAPCWVIADDAHLWLWVTNNFLPDGLWIMEALGFRYITNRVWAKMEEAPSQAVFSPGEHKPVYRRCRMGLGQYLRGCHELLLFGVRGKTMKPDTSVAMPSLLLAPTQEHSVKPAQAYKDIERVSPGPYLEMFARETREGWISWGNEVGE
jgi:N6-adenosine-specific RNA methylase IME4